MYKSNPYARVKENAINTATPEELTLMLYDGALKFANKAIISLEKSDYMEVSNFINRTKNIIRELQVTLNMSYEISNQLYDSYDYILFRLTEANIKKSPEMLNEAIDYIRMFRDTWKQVIKIARTKK